MGVCPGVAAGSRRPWGAKEPRDAQDFGSIYTPVHFTSPNTYTLRLVSLKSKKYAQAVSSTIKVSVTQPFPVVSGGTGSIDAKLDSSTEEVITAGTPVVDSSVTTCFDPTDIYSCSTDTPLHGEYLTVALTITMLKGTHDYNIFDFSIKTPDGQVYDPTFEDTNHGQALDSGTLVAPDEVSGMAVFDVPPGTEYRLVIEDFDTFLGYLPV